MLATSSIIKKVILSVICLCFTSITILGFFAYRYQMHQLREGLQDQARSESSLFNSILTANAEGLARAHTGLDRLDELLKPFAASDKDELLAAARPIFNEMRQNNNITHMYFIQLDGKVLLRVHQPEQAGDVLKRTTFLKAQATKRPASGLEMGQNYFSLRSVSPVSFRGKPIGYLEVAEEIDHVFMQMKRISGNDVSLFLTEDFLNSQSTRVKGEKAGNFRILYPTNKDVALALAARLQPEMKGALREPKVSIVSYQGGKYAVSIGPVRDAAGVTAGVLLSHKEVTSLFSNMWAGVTAYMAILIAILLSSLFLLYLSLKKSLALFRMLKEHIVSVTTTWDLTKRLRIDTHDEIGELAEDFNTMTEKLRVLNMELEQRVTDKEQMLIHQSRMAAMGEMIGCIAHQWRQPLNTLGLIVQELPIYFKRGAFSQEYLDASTSKARELIAHMSQTIEDFRNFFKPEKQKVRFMVRDVLDKTLKLIDASFSDQQIALDVLVEDDAACEGYPNEYCQVILNILTNVSDVFLERKVAKPNVVIRIFQENERSVMSISDNAGGIPEEIIDKIFDPYFTTKDPEKGTGLGLYMSKAIIEKNMGGRLSVRNTVDGAEFRIEVCQEL